MSNDSKLSNRLLEKLKELEILKELARAEDFVRTPGRAPSELDVLDSVRYAVPAHQPTAKVIPFLKRDNSTN